MWTSNQLVLSLHTRLQIKLCLVALQVFLTIARKAEVEAAAQEGRSSETIHLPGGALLKVPLGEEYAQVEGNTEQYQVKWAQDESGNLQVQPVMS